MSEDRDRRVVYGTDDRHDEAFASAANRAMGKSTVMLVCELRRLTHIHTLSFNARFKLLLSDSSPVS